MVQRRQANKGRSRGSNDGRGGRDLLHSPDYLDGLMINSDLPNVAKELVHPGKKGDPLDLLMRSIIKDERQLNAIVQYFALCDDFNLPEEKKVLVYRLAGSVSLDDGRARKELVMATTGIVDPSVWRRGEKKWRDKSSDSDKDREGGRDGR